MNTKGIRVAAASAAMVLLGGAGGAFAADLDAMPTKASMYKAPANSTCTSVVDFFTTACQLSAYGIRFYGTLDAGFGYQTNGAPLDTQKYGAGVDYFLGKNSAGGKWLIAPNALSQSNVGFQIKEPLGAGWSFVGQVETQIVPETMAIANAAGSVAEWKGVPLAYQHAYGDSSSQGAFYNGLGFAGISHDTYGTLTFMRQATLTADAVNTYDPMGNSYAFSMLGYFGSFAGGGDTENRKDTTSVKYRVSYANYHFGLFGQFGGYSEGNASKGAFQASIGGDWNIGPGILSADAIGGYTKDGVTIGLIGPANAFGVPTGLTTSPTTLGATITDNTSVMLATKYTMDKLKLYAGWEWIQFANGDPVSSFTDTAGDFICSGACGTANLTSISATPFAHGDKYLQVFWAGARYSITDSLDLSGAYYHEHQSDYSGGVANSGGVTCDQVSTSASSCAGNIDAFSLVLDYKFAPKWDTYIGTLYSKNMGGLDNGYESSSNWATTAGIRFRW